MHMRRIEAAVLFVALWGVAAVARAEATVTDPSFDIQLFEPTAGGTNFFSTESGKVNSHFGTSAALNINYGRNPLSVRLVNPDNSEESVGAVVANRVDSTLLAAFGFYDIAELGVALPMVWQGGYEQNRIQAANVNVGIQSLDAFVVGDVRLIPKVSFYSMEDGLFSGAIVANVRVPLAQGAGYASEARPVYAPALALSSRIGPFRAALNAGYRVRTRTTVRTDDDTPIITLDDELFARLGASFDVTLGSSRPIEIIGEVYGRTPARGAFSSQGENYLQRRQQSSRTTVEGLLGGRMEVVDDFYFAVGAGGGLTRSGYGQAAPRAFAQMQYYTGEPVVRDTDEDGLPDGVDKCPEDKEDIDTFQDKDGCPDLDNDGDSVLDEDDDCPLEVEDKDGFEDLDGCPEKDNDQDGLLDGEDQCPVDAEDADDFEDEDGCPDLDNDGDAIADKVDECPLQQEDEDGYLDSDGCPEADNDEDGLNDLNDLCPNHAEDKDGVADDDGCPEDNDGDGIVDADDKCPDKAEIYNGIKDADGCPERLRRRSLVEVTEEKIEIKEKVYFRTGRARIRRRSFKMLNQVASVLRNYEHIEKVRIEGHTDARGPKRRNQRLSQRRAEAVRQFLVNKGIAPERLVAKGYGEQMPIASNRTRPGRRRNRRVEFVILERSPLGEDVSAQQAGPDAADATEDGGESGEQPEAGGGGDVEFEFGASGEDDQQGTSGGQKSGEQAGDTDSPKDEKDSDIEFEF